MSEKGATDNCNTIFGIPSKWCNISLGKNNESRFAERKFESHHWKLRSAVERFM